MAFENPLMARKKPNDNPYLGFTLEQLFRIESNSFVVQVGDDFFSNDSGYAFTKTKAEYFYDEIYKSLTDLLHTGITKDKEEAMEVLKSFKILPLRLH